MITVIGTSGCGNCRRVCTMLKQKNISYNYELFNELTEEKQNKYLESANENNQQSFPIILSDDKLTTLEDIIANEKNV